MIDISKCAGSNCDLKEKCLRYTANDDGIMQRWVAGAYDPKYDRCDLFLGVRAGTLDVLHEERLKLVHELETENTKLRAMLAKSNAECVYCGLRAEQLNQCPKGFPGCGRADDLVLGEGDDC